MALFRIDQRDPLPLYAQLERGIRLTITTGKLKVGDRLPTVRALAVDLKVNANTIARVYAELERDGILATKRGVGTFVHAEPAATRPLPRSERNQLLRSLAEHVLHEVTASGFTTRELIQQLERLSSDTKEKPHGK